jgi:hypothetical protein
MSNLKKSFKKFFIFAIVFSSLILSTINIDSKFDNFLNKKMIKVFDQDTKFPSKMFPISYVYEEEGEETSILDFVTPGPAVFTNTSGTQITLTYNRVLDTNSIPSITDFELAAFTRLGNATGSVISSVRIIGSEIALGITNNIQCSHELTLAYEPGTNKIKDLDGNLAPRVTTSVRNNVELTSACIEPPDGGSDEYILDFVTPGPAVFTNLCGTQITLTYNRVLDSNSIPSITDFELAAFTSLGNATGSLISSVRIIGSKIELGITNNIQSSHGLTLAYEPGTNKIKDLDGNLAPRVTTSVRNNVELTSACNESSGGGGSTGGGGSPGGVTPNPPPTIVINQVRVNVNLFLVLTADQISSITPNQIRTISTNLIRKLNPDSATGLTPEQIKAFSPNQIRFMSVNVISVLSPQQIAGLEPNDFKVLTNRQITNISAEAATGISAADLKVLNRNQLKSFKPNVIANIQPTVLKFLSISNLRNLTPAQKRSISKFQRKALSVGQLRAIRI